jgi:hypothetical protein
MPPWRRYCDISKRRWDSKTLHGFERGAAACAPQFAVCNPKASECWSVPEAFASSNLGRNEKFQPYVNKITGHTPGRYVVTSVVEGQPKKSCVAATAR